MSDASPGVSQQAAERAISSSQSDASAWDALKLRQANYAATIDNLNATNASVVSNLVNNNSATISYLASLNSQSEDQTGATENQSNVTPIRTGVGDAIAAVPGVAAGQVSANVAEQVSGLIQALLSTLAAIQPVLVNASGGASTPSQTTPKT